VRLRYALQIAEGMSYFAQNGFIHRDLKPANVLIDDTDTAKIADFGLARDVPPRKSLKATSMVGTPLYEAPELFDRTVRYGGEVDVYSYGIMLWELATGEEAWATSNIRTMLELEKRVVKEKKRPSDYCDAKVTPKELDDLVRVCWHPKQAERPTWRHILQTLQQVMTSLRKP